MALKSTEPTLGGSGAEIFVQIAEPSARSLTIQLAGPVIHFQLTASVGPNACRHLVAIGPRFGCYSTGAFGWGEEGSLTKRLN